MSPIMPSRGGYTVKKFFNQITLRVMLRTPVKNDFKQLNGSQETVEHKKGRNTQRRAKNNSKQLLLEE